MKLQEAIDKRRSIREFESRKVPREIIKKLIINASKAPSAANTQPWEFYVIDSEDKINKIAKMNGTLLISRKESFDKLEKKLKVIANSFYATLGNCKTIILVYIEKDKNKIIEENKIKSVSASIENLMLSALEQGLGTCWMGSFVQVEEEINRLIGIRNKKLISGVLLGYPKRGYKPLIRKKKKLNEILKFVK
jgi:nitroreductase